MVRFLIQGFGRADRDTIVQRILIDSAIEIMGIMSPVAEALTLSPASPSHPGVNAGVTFATMRFYQPFVWGRTEWQLLASRLQELADGAGALKALLPAADGLAQRLAQMGQRFSALAEEHKTSPTDTSVKEQSTIPPDTNQTSTPASSVEIAEGKKVTIKFDSKPCIHSRFCVLWQPQVYKANTLGARIDPDQDSIEGIIGVAHNCPSGAIQYERQDGGPPEPSPRVNLINVRENWPLAFRRELVLEG